MKFLTALLNLLFPQLPLPYRALDAYPWRPLTNGERRARWASRYYQLSESDKQIASSAVRVLPAMELDSARLPTGSLSSAAAEFPAAEGR